MKNYCINDEYKSRSYEEFQKAIIMPVPGVINGKAEAQEEVYIRAKKILVENNLNSILDIGCGSGFKLLKHFGDYSTIGIDLKCHIDILKSRYPNKKWIVSDFSESLKLDSIDIVISADVIEHLFDPDEMINWIKKLSPKFIVISTPDKDTLIKEKTSKTGPPQNIWHVREWNRVEFSNYIGQFFEIIEQFNTSQCGYEYQTVICKIK